MLWLTIIFGLATVGSLAFALWVWFVSRRPKIEIRTIKCKHESSYHWEAWLGNTMVFSDGIHYGSRQEAAKVAIEVFAKKWSITETRW